MKALAFLAIILLVSCCPPPVENTEQYKEGNKEVADKGICGDKFCSENERSPQSNTYCRQDCYP